MISSTLYKEIADLINDAQARGADIASNVYQMKTDLQNSEIHEDNIYRQLIENVVDSTYDVLNNRHNLYASEMLGFVSSLQRHVDNNYSSVNDFLQDNAIQVYSIFASVSEEAGFLINNENIIDVS